jgi:hypothetical protein
MSQSRTKGLTIASASLVIGTMLGGCSEFYFDRRDTVALASGDAVAVDRVTQTIDPWSAASANRNIPYDGNKAATAAERYRTNRVIKPVGIGTSSANYQGQQSSPAMTASGGGGGQTP